MTPLFNYMVTARLKSVLSSETYPGTCSPTPVNGRLLTGVLVAMLVFLIITLYLNSLNFILSEENFFHFHKQKIFALGINGFLVLVVQEFFLRQSTPHHLQECL